MKRAILANVEDNVVTAVNAIDAGEIFEYLMREAMVNAAASEAISAFHKIAIADIAKGAPVIKYGEVIGKASKAIKAGDCVHIHNLDSNRGRGDQPLAKGDVNTVKASSVITTMTADSSDESTAPERIKGYRRENGAFGIRNHLAIIPTSVCASETATRISVLVPGSVALPHQSGCCQVGEDYRQTLRTLIGLGKNPNVGAVLVVGLGCEGIKPQEVADAIAETGKCVETVIIQEWQGTLGAIQQGVRLASQMMQMLSGMPSAETDVSELVLALECGGSDPTSGIAANPAVGCASDMLIARGGRSILSETTEMIGAEHLLAARAVNESVAAALFKIVNQTEARAIAMGEDLRGSQPTPGNIQGGLTTIEEKSLGCLYKAGHAVVQDVLTYAETTGDAKGLYIMDTPGQDIDSITGMLAGGAQIVVFTTGRGTPTGSPIAPVIKITGNSVTFENMRDNMDIDAGRIISEGASIETIGDEIFREMVQVANGKRTRAEVLGHQEFGIFRVGYTF
jgi:altronate dehydratase large subunit